MKLTKRGLVVLLVLYLVVGFLAGMVLADWIFVADWR